MVTGWPGGWAGSWAGGWTGSEGAGGGPVYLDAGFAALAGGQGAFGSDVSGGVIAPPVALGGGWPMRPRPIEEDLPPPARIWLDAGMVATAGGAAWFGANLVVQQRVSAEAIAGVAAGRPAQFVGAGLQASAGSVAAAESEAPDRYAVARAEDEEILWLLAA